VPLVQKLKRYGTRVLGIGVEGGVSSVLVQACDSFVYYDDLLPDTEEPVAAAPPPVDMNAAYSLMRRAADAIVREGRQPVGALVLSMMRQLDPSFDLVRFRTTLKELAAGAHESGHVRVVEQPGTDLLLVPTDTTTTPPSETRALVERHYDFRPRARRSRAIAPSSKRPACLSCLGTSA
jgi:hypothetical protein